MQFLSTAPSIPESPLGDIQLTSSPTLNFLQLAILTVQRAPAVGASAVQARGTDGGAARDWEGLCGRYIRLGGREGVLANRDVQEVSIICFHASASIGSRLYRPHAIVAAGERAVISAGCHALEWMGWDDG